MAPEAQDLTKSQLRELRSIDFDALFERRFHDGYRCPHCSSERVHRHGRYRGRQRFRCVQCRKTFNELTGTPMDGTRYPDKWLPYIYCLAQGFSLRRTARLLGISVQTAFAWRHKLLAALRQGQLPTVLEGIIEADEVYVLEAQKGSRHLNRPPRRRGTGHFVSRRFAHPNRYCAVAFRDRIERSHAAVLGLGQPTVFQLEEALAATEFRGHFLCVDNRQAYWSLAVRHGLHREVFRHPSRTRQLFHMRRADQFWTQFKQWIGRFNGISTCYLDHYIDWFLEHERATAVDAGPVALCWNWLLQSFELPTRRAVQA